jgi:hypothetical protein
LPNSSNCQTPLAGAVPHKIVCGFAWRAKAASPASIEYRACSALPRAALFEATYFAGLRKAGVPEE